MTFRAVFRSGDAIVGTLNYEGTWEDFIMRYQFDPVLEERVRLESELGCSVSISVEPIEESAHVRRARTFLGL